jgi:hypothetical protein
MLPALDPAVEWLESTFDERQLENRLWILRDPPYRQGLESKTMVWTPWIFNFRHDSIKEGLSPDWYVWTKGTPIVGDYSKPPMSQYAIDFGTATRHA